MSFLGLLKQNCLIRSLEGQGDYNQRKYGQAQVRKCRFAETYSDSQGPNGDVLDITITFWIQGHVEIEDKVTYNEKSYIVRRRKAGVNRVGTIIGYVCQASNDFDTASNKNDDV